MCNSYKTALEKSIRSQPCLRGYLLGHCRPWQVAALWLERRQFHVCRASVSIHNCGSMFSPSLRGLNTATIEIRVQMLLLVNAKLQKKNILADPSSQGPVPPPNVEDTNDNRTLLTVLHGDAAYLQCYSPTKLDRSVETTVNSMHARTHRILSRQQRALGCDLSWPYTQDVAERHAVEPKRRKNLTLANTENVARPCSMSSELGWVHSFGWSVGELGMGTPAALTSPSHTTK